ncbi:unnamed protein product [Lampetra fluviatilis]
MWYRRRACVEPTRLQGCADTHVAAFAEGAVHKTLRSAPPYQPSAPLCPTLPAILLSSPRGSPVRGVEPGCRIASGSGASPAGLAPPPSPARL